MPQIYNEMKWPDGSHHFVRLLADENIKCSSTRKKVKSRASHWIRQRMCNIVQRQKKKKRSNQKDHKFLPSSTTPSDGDEDSVFTSSTVVSTSSSVQYTTDKTETVPLSPKLEENKGCRRETKGTCNYDPFAKQSKLMKKSRMKVNIIGDNDIWEERTLIKKSTGEQRSFFYSTNTGFRVMDEPPTGATCVIYLEN